MVLAGYMRGVMLRYGSNRVGYELRAFDPWNGKKLWSRDYGGNPPRVGFQDEPPVTFTDPQGERVVVGWDATGDMAREAVKHNAVARQNMKPKKITNHDTVFEVLDGWLLHGWGSRIEFLDHPTAEQLLHDLGADQV